MSTKSTIICRQALHISSYFILLTLPLKPPGPFIFGKTSWEIFLMTSFIWPDDSLISTCYLQKHRTYNLQIRLAKQKRDTFLSNTVFHRCYWLFRHFFPHKQWLGNLKAQPHLTYTSSVGWAGLLIPGSKRGEQRSVDYPLGGTYFWHARVGYEAYLFYSRPP